MAKTKRETRDEAVERANREREQRWLLHFAMVALMEGRVHWSAWRRVGTARGGRATGPDSYRVGIFDVGSTDTARVIYGFRYPTQRDSWEVMTWDRWRQWSQNVGGMTDDSLLLRELFEWSQGIMNALAEAKS